jgi:hypothetical protein
MELVLSAYNAIAFAFGIVTPDLRGVAYALQLVQGDRRRFSARFLYDGDVGDFQEDLTSSAETYVLADLPAGSEDSLAVEFTAVPNADLELLEGEAFLYTR